jgi:hypothetical protein
LKRNQPLPILVTSEQGNGVNMASNYSELGVSGLSQWGGRISEDFLVEWRGKRGYKRANEMRLNSPTVNALLTAIKLSIRKSKWQLISAEGDEDPRLELVQAALENMSYSWNDHISQALTMLPFGYSLFEIVYERVGGLVLWRKLAQRSQDTIDRWDIGDKGGINGCWQVSNTNYQQVYLPIEKLLLYRTETEKNNPEGRSILRTAWIPYYYMKNIQMVEGIGIERDLAGMPVIHLPEGADTSDSDSSDLGKAKKVVRNIRRDQQEGVVMPNGWELELLSSGGQRQFDTTQVIQRYKKDILMNSLAQFLALGLDSTGAYSLSKDMTDLFVMSVNAVASIISETFSKFAIPRLLRLNGLEENGISYVATPAGDTDVTEIADLIQKAGGYITWTPEDQLVLRELMGLPEVDIDRIMEMQEQQQAETDARVQAAADAAQQNMAAVFGGVEEFEISKAERARKESEYQKRITDFFAGQQKRIGSEAQSIKRQIS